MRGWSRGPRRRLREDPIIYAVVAGVLLVVALVAAVVPALRATRIDPNSALRLD